MKKLNKAPATSPSHKIAFSLVELSIVLVIIGLLVGGILSGQSLIRAAEMRAVISQFEKYRAGMYSFRDKYFVMPGDMVNATSFWGSAGGTGSDMLALALRLPVQLIRAMVMVMDKSRDLAG